MPSYNASKGSDSPESSLEDLQTAALARYPEKTGSSLQKYYTSGPSTVTSESQHATESSGIQHDLYDAGRQTNPTSVPSQVGDAKSIPSNESDYGSSTDRSRAFESRTNSDPIEDLRTPHPAEVLGGIGSHFDHDSESTEFLHPVSEREDEAIGNRVAHTHAELQEALTNGAQQMRYHGEPYQVCAQAQHPTGPINENQTVGLERQEGQDDIQSAGPQQQHPNSVERASEMRFCYWIFCHWISCIRR